MRPSFALLIVVLLSQVLRAADAIELRDLDGKPHRPLEAAKDKKASVLIFITHDCPIANAFAPEMRRIVEAYEKKSVAFFLVHVDPTLSSADARKHATDYSLAGTILFDPQHRLAKQVKATITPQAIVLSPEAGVLYRGRIDDLYADLGKKRVEPTRRDLREALDEILGGRAVSVPETKAVGCLIPDVKPEKD
jgi:hypothetical protein